MLKLFESSGRLHVQMWSWIFLWFSMMSPINNVLLWFARASYNVQVSVMKVFKCSVDYSLQNFVSHHSLVLMELSYKRSAALLLACFLYCSSLDFGSLREFRKTTLPILMLNFFSVDLIDVSSEQCAAFLFSCFLFWFKSQSWKCSSLLKNMFCKTLFQMIHCCCDGTLLSAQRCFAFRLLLILFNCQCWNSSRLSVDYTCNSDADHFSCGFHRCILQTMRCFAFLVLTILFNLNHGSLQLFVEYVLQNFVSN